MKPNTLVKSLPPVNFKGETVVEKFEGCEVPECTKEEVIRSIENYACCISGDRCPVKNCIGCVLSRENRAKGITQRYLDSRWPKDKDPKKKIAVHCPTKELWDRVQKKADVGEDNVDFTDTGGSLLELKL